MDATPADRRGRRGQEQGRGRDAPLRVTVTDPDGQRPEQVECDLVLVGVGRRPNTAGLELERAGVATDQRGWVPVDERLRTNVPGVQAIGDVTGKVLLAHVASHQGLVAAGVLAGHDERMDDKAVPAATFTHPEVASVGLTEAAAREAGHDVVVAASRSPPWAGPRPMGPPRAWSRWSPRPGTGRCSGSTSSVPAPAT